MCDQQSLWSACPYVKSDQSLCLSLEYSMSVKLLTEHHLVFLGLKGGSTGSSKCHIVVNLMSLLICWSIRKLAIWIPPPFIWSYGLYFYSLHAWLVFMLMLCCLLTFFNINFFRKFFQEYYQSAKWFGSRSGPTFCQSWSGSKLPVFAKVFFYMTGELLWLVVVCHCRRQRRHHPLPIDLNDICSLTTCWILTKVCRCDPYTALFNNCSNGSSLLRI